jgi:hypothetical protein
VSFFFIAYFLASSCLFRMIITPISSSPSLLFSQGSLHTARNGPARVAMLYLAMPMIVLLPHLRLFPIHSTLYRRRRLFLGFHHSPTMIAYGHMCLRFHLSCDHFHASYMVIAGRKNSFADILFSLPLRHAETYGRPCLHWIFARA